MIKCIKYTYFYGVLRMNNDNEKWIGIEEAADYLGVKSSTLRDWIKIENDIPACKIGKKIMTLSWRNCDPILI